ncbi:MAG TPA: hypothetical protein VHB25_14680 [Gemmatimonadaceae bacterium]|nr:hypothetical protein [Gemmatimonadaceae bacterium]
MDRPRRTPEYEAEVKERQDRAGRFGFILGCVAAVAALAINLWRIGPPWDTLTLVSAVLMAALNVPIGIALGLLGEKVTRRPPGGPGR